jgi:hypothetical protein
MPKVSYQLGLHAKWLPWGATSACIGLTYYRFCQPLHHQLTLRTLHLWPLQPAAWLNVIPAGSTGGDDHM